VTLETLDVPRAAFDIEDPWTAPASARAVRLRCATDGSAPRLATSVALWYDEECLSILFSFADDRILAAHLAHDAPLYEQDVVEAFLAPAAGTEYFELEVSPRGTIFDARITSPDGVRETMHVDRGWTCAGLTAPVRIVTESSGAMTVDVLMRIPFRALGEGIPSPGRTWRANFFRIDRHPERGDEFSAWQPTMRRPADFHVVAAFGTLRFQ
jgi:Carbohydrate-binding family 9